MYRLQLGHGTSWFFRLSLLFIRVPLLNSPSAPARFYSSALTLVRYIIVLVLFSYAMCQALWSNESEDDGCRIRPRLEDYGRACRSSFNLLMDVLFTITTRSHHCYSLSKIEIFEALLMQKGRYVLIVGSGRVVPRAMFYLITIL